MYHNKFFCALKRGKLIFCALLLSFNGLASTSGNLPFNRALDVFKTNFTAALFVILFILWIATMVMMAFGEWTDGVKRILNILCWGSLALAGPTLLTTLFGVGALI